MPPHAGFAKRYDSGISTLSAPMRRWRRFIAKHEADDTLPPDDERTLETLIEARERLTALVDYRV